MGEVRKSKWESIDDSSSRLKVPGGWLVRSTMWASSGVSTHTVFVADPGWLWELP